MDEADESEVALLERADAKTLGSVVAAGSATFDSKVSAGHPPKASQTTSISESFVPSLALQSSSSSGMKSPSPPLRGLLETPRLLEELPKALLVAALPPLSLMSMSLRARSILAALSSAYR